jgi:hypothetical protein
MAKHNARIGSMFNQHRRTLMRAGTLLLALLLLAASGWAQDFVNSGTLTNYGTLTIKANLVNTLNGVINNATSTARIRFTSNTGQFRNEQPDITKITNNGWFIFEGTNNPPTHKLFTDGTGDPDGLYALGSRCNFRVPGNMRYTASSGTQKVQARYYTNLEMDGASEKAIPDAVYVSGTYNVVFGSGNRTYSGTFYYDGTGPQTIFAEYATSGSVNRYNNLAIMTGSGDCAAGTSTKTIEDNETISLMGNFLSADNRTTLLLKGQLFAVDVTANGPITINDPTTGATFAELRTTGTATYAANVTVTAGLFKVAGGTATVQSTLSLANSLDAKLRLDENTTLDIEGELQNYWSARTNWTFDANSTIRFTRIADGQTIPYTVASNPYGNVYTSGGTKSTESGGDVVMAGNDLTVKSGNITVASTHVWNMTNPSATVTYSNPGENSEIVGKMQRKISGAGPYIFNNAQTQVTFTDGTLPTTMTLAVFPETDPNNYDPTKDVRRKVTVSWSGDDNWTATFRVGYKTTDIPNTWVSSVSQSNLRFYESPATNPPPPGTPEKVSTGYSYNRWTASGADLGYIELAGIRGTGTAAPNGRGFIASGNDLLLRGGPSVFYAIRSGRWSNPNTWDEGVEPSPGMRWLLMATPCTPATSARPTTILALKNTPPSWQPRLRLLGTGTTARCCSAPRSVIDRRPSA